MTSPTSPTRLSGSRPPGWGGNQRLVIIGAVVAVAVALVVALLVAGGDGDGDTSASDTTAAAADTGASSPGPVTIDGTPLPRFTSTDDDPAVGTTLPTLTGTDLEGRPMTIGPDGRPKMIVFLAHWCPHCQAEVPVVQQWVDDGRLPEDVDLVSVSTAVDDRRPNYPPQQWLEREGWTAPVLDDEDDGAAAAAGLSAFPYFVFVDGENTVVARTTGELPPARLDEYAAILAAAT